MERAPSAGISWEETDLITTICAICLKTCKSSPGCEGSAECQEGGNVGGPGVVKDGFLEAKFGFRRSPASSCFLAQQQQPQPKLTFFSKGKLNCLGNSPVWGMLLFPICFFLTHQPSPKHALGFHRIVS